MRKTQNVLRYPWEFPKLIEKKNTARFMKSMRPYLLVCFDAGNVKLELPAWLNSR